MKKNHIKLLSIAALGIASLTACLKDDDHYVDFAAQPVMAEFQVKEKTSAVFEAIAEPQKYEVVVSVASPTALKADMPITLEYAPDSLTKYNAAHHTTMEVLPAEAYTIPSLNVVVPAGQRTVKLPITVNASVIDLSKSYAIPLRIKSASGAGLSTNYNTLIVIIAVKNSYDGKYKVNGKALRAGDDVLSGAFPEQDYSLITTSKYSVKMSRVACWASGANIGGISEWELTVDPATNKVTVKDAVNAAVVNNPAGVNKYDPETKTFSISVYWGTGPTNRAWEATFKYDKPR